MNLRKQISFLILCFLAGRSLQAQEAYSTRYFDSTWEPTGKDTAFYMKQFYKNDSNYQVKIYWVKSGGLYMNYFSKDSSFKNKVGLYKSFFYSGELKDSSIYDSEGNMVESHIFYVSGMPHGNYYFDTGSKKEIAEGHDEGGRPIKNFVFMREADFPGGNEAWQHFLAKNIKSKIPVKNDAPYGTYKVIVQFIVDEQGNLSDIGVQTNNGYGMEEEVLRVLKKSPRWIPAIWLNKPTKAYRRQPVTFVIPK